MKEYNIKLEIKDAIDNNNVKKLDLIAKNYYQELENYLKVFNKVENK